MGIDGVTNVNGADLRARPPLLGKIAKGELGNRGPSDLDYFRFVGFGPNKDRLEEIWREVYGERPVSFNDVRIPVGVAGNFNIENCAWMRAHMYMKRGEKRVPMLLAEGTGKWVSRMRNQGDASKFDFFESGELAQASITQMAANEEGKSVPHLKWNGRLYPWRPEMVIDLVFWEFAEAVYADGRSGHGVVRFVTHATTDIANLIGEYRAILERIASAFSMSLGGYERALIQARLDIIPLRFWRQSQLTTTPDYRKGASPSNRLTSERSFVHWGLNPQIAAALSAVIQANTERMLTAMLRGALPAGDINAELGLGTINTGSLLPAAAGSADSADDDAEAGEVWDEDNDDMAAAEDPEPGSSAESPVIDPETGEILSVGLDASSAETTATDEPAPNGGVSVGGSAIHSAVPGDHAQTLADFAKWYVDNDPLRYYEKNYQVVQVLRDEWPDIGITWAVKLYNGQPSSEIYEVLDAHARRRGPEKAAKSKK